MPRAGMAQNLAPNFSFKHGRRQSTKFSYRPVGLGSEGIVSLANEERVHLYKFY
jgi:hypothetical protein